MIDLIFLPQNWQTKQKARTFSEFSCSFMIGELSVENQDIGHKFETTELLPSTLRLEWNAVKELDPPQLDNTSQGELVRLLSSSLDIQQAKTKFVYIDLDSTRKIKWEWFKNSADTDALFIFCDQYTDGNTKYHFESEALKKEDPASNGMIYRNKPIKFTDKRFKANRLHFLLKFDDPSSG